MICYYFPPLADVGCKRSVAFAKYLHKMGWDVHAVSVKNPDLSYCQKGNDLPPEGVPTTYTRSLFHLNRVVGKLNALVSLMLAPLGINPRVNLFANLLCIPDQFIGWIPLTVHKAYTLVKRHRFDLIYVSCSPFSSALIGVVLKKLTGKPLVIDFRDPFALEGPSYRRLLKSRIALNIAYESYVIRQADLFIVNSREIENEYAQVRPESRGKTHFVHNGFDPDFLPQDPLPAKFSRFTLIYTGEFYFFSPEYIQTLFQGLRLLREEGTIDPESFQFLFYGNGHTEIKKLSNTYAISDVVSAAPRIPYREILSAILQSHLLLLRIVKRFISTKLFEGIALNVPFLATIPNGEAEELIRMYSPGSYIVTEERPELVAQAIRDGIAAYAHHEVPDNHVQEFLNDFSRESLTRKLAGHIEEHLFGPTSPSLDSFAEPE